MQDDTKQIEEVNVTRHIAKRTAKKQRIPRPFSKQELSAKTV